MRNYKTRIPGIDRASEAKNPGGKLKSSALQKVGDPQGKIMSEPAKYRQAPNNFNPVPGTSSNKFLGGAIRGIGKMAKGALTGSDGKFNLKDVGRLALGPVGALAGGLLSKKAKYTKR